jgi:uncharacterized HAD superfamily protein
MSKTICLDFDGVITDIGASLKNYANRDLIDFDPVHIGEALLTPDGVDYLEYIFEDPLFWRTLKPIKSSWHTINSWFMSDYDIVFVTARRSSTSVGEMIPWLDRWQVMYSDIIVCDMGYKYEHLLKLNPVLYVDDNPSEIKKINKETNVKSFVIKHWYNEHLIDKSVNWINDISHIQVQK